MKLLSFIFFCLIAVKGSYAVELAFKQDSEWLTWKQKHDKSYESDIHELEKYVTWISNRALIEAHNQLKSDFGYRLAINQFGDLVSSINDHIIVLVKLLQIHCYFFFRHLLNIIMQPGVFYDILTILIETQHKKGLNLKQKNSNGRKD